MFCLCHFSQGKGAARRPCRGVVSGFGSLLFFRGCRKSHLWRGATSPLPCTTVLIRCNWARGFWHSSRRSTFDLLLLDLFHCPNFARSFFGLVALCWLFSLCFCLVVPVAWVWVLCRFAIVLSLLLCCAACCVDFQCAVLCGQSCAWFFGTKQTKKERKEMMGTSGCAG